MEEFGGGIWLLVAIGFACAGIAIAYGAIRSRRKTAKESSEQRAATRKVYREEDAED
jgi:hypothetical protein